LKVDLDEGFGVFLKKCPFQESAQHQNMSPVCAKIIGRILGKCAKIDETRNAVGAHDFAN